MQKEIGSKIQFSMRRVSGCRSSGKWHLAVNNKAELEEELERVKAEKAAYLGRKGC